MKCFAVDIIYLEDGVLKTTVGIKWVGESIFHALQKVEYGTFPDTEIISINVTEERGN